MKYSNKVLRYLVPMPILCYLSSTQTMTLGSKAQVPTNELLPPHM